MHLEFISTPSYDPIMPYYRVGEAKRAFAGAKSSADVKMNILATVADV